MKFTQKILFLSVITLLSLGNSIVITEAQGDSFTIWLGVEDSVADAIETALGSVYTYIRNNEFTLAEDLNRENILGQLPNLIIGLNDAIPNLAVKNIIRPVQDLKLNDVFPILERQASFYRVNNISKTQSIIVPDVATLYGYPIAVTTTMIFANENLVDLTANNFDSIDAFNTAALFSNDQSNPTNKIFGFGLNSIIDPMIWLYYANDGRIFSNDVLDLDNLIVNEQTSIDALAAINTLINVQRLVPQDTEETLLKQFSELENVAMLIGGFDTNPAIVDSGLTGVQLFAAPGGAPVHSYNVMVSTSASGEADQEARDIFDILFAESFQSTLPDLGRIPVSQKGIDASTLTDTQKTEVSNAVVNGLETPIDHVWVDVLDRFENQLTKLYAGDQDGIRTALASEIDMRILLPQTAQWGPIPLLSGASETQDKDDTPFQLEFWMITLILGYISFVYRRKIRR